MNSRERVLRAFKVKPGMPDRIPVQFDLCRQLQDHFAKELGLPSTYTNNIYEDVTYRISGNEIRLAMGSDVVIVGPSESKDFAAEKFEDGTWTNEYHMRMKKGDIYVEVAEYPLADAMTKDDVEAFEWMDTADPSRYWDVEEQVKKYKDDYVVIGDIELTIFSLAQQLVGMEKVLLDMAMGEEYLTYLFEKCGEFQTKLGLELIKRGVDAIWVGDDFGSQTSLLFSPQMFRDILKPIYKKMLDAFKAAKPDMICILHCDGAVSALLDDIYDVGFTVFNPVQPGVPGHSAKEIKDGFGEKFAFWGAIDQQYLLPRGSDEELEADIKEKCEILGKNGGYMIAPAHIMQSDISPERVKRFIELCKKYGRYQ